MDTTAAAALKQAQKLVPGWFAICLLFGDLPHRNYVSAVAHSPRECKPIYQKSGKSIKKPVQNQDRLAAQNEGCESRIQRRILTWGRQAAPESVPPGGPELGPRFLM